MWNSNLFVYVWLQTYKTDTLKLNAVKQVAEILIKIFFIALSFSFLFAMLKYKYFKSVIVI